MRKRRAVAATTALAPIAMVMLSVTPAAASSPYPVGPPNQPPTYGDCVSTVAAGEGTGDYSVVQTFVALVAPVPSQRPGVEESFVCKGFSPP